MGHSEGPGAAVNLLVIGLALIGFVHAPRRVMSPTMLAWGGFLLAALASLLHGPDPAGGTRLLLTLVTYAAAFSLPFAIVRNRQTAAQCLWIAFLSSLGPAAWAAVKLATSSDIVFGDGRLQSTFSHPNIFAFFIVGLLALTLLITSSSLVRLDGAHRRLLHVYVVGLLALLLFTKTRSAWIAAVLIFIGHALFVDRRWLALLAVLPVALLIPGVAERIGDLNAGNVDLGFAKLNSLAWREELWDDTLQWMRDNPSILLGHGLDLYASYVPLFFSRGEDQSGVGAHNTFLQIYFEMGLVGLSAFLTIFIVLFAELRRGLAHARDGVIVMGALCVGYFVICFSDNVLDYLSFEWFFWFVLGTVLARVRVLRSAPAEAMSLQRGHARPLGGIRSAGSIIGNESGEFSRR